MPFGDIDRKFCYSLTDFHDFDFCQFRFFVKHHLNKKYEIEGEGNPSMALGTLLDQSIKKFHEAKAYGQPKEYLENIVRAAANFIREDAANKPSPSFYTAMLPFLDEELIAKATKIFQNYYEARDGKIRSSLGKVGFCDWVLSGDDQSYKLWGGPDAIELGDDGIPEVVDYKSREDVEKAKETIDMDLMPKIYTLLVAKSLLEKGYKKARFIVRLWQAPNDESMSEEFDLTNISDLEPVFRQRIGKILEVEEIRFCEKDFCKACQSENRDKYLYQLEKMGLSS